MLNTLNLDSLPLFSCIWQGKWKKTLIILVQKIKKKRENEKEKEKKFLVIWGKPTSLLFFSLILIYWISKTSVQLRNLQRNDLVRLSSFHTIGDNVNNFILDTSWVKNKKPPKNCDIYNNSNIVKVTVYLQIGNFLQISIFRLKHTV